MPKSNKLAENEVQVDRRFQDRREDGGAVEQDVEASDSASPEFKAPRRKKQRRRQIDPTTCERDYNDDEITFMQALDEYKRSSGRMFPTCSEILEVVRGLGYVKLSEEEQQLIDSINEVEEELAEAAVDSGDLDSFDVEEETAI